MPSDKNTLLALVANLFPDNNNKEITAARLRQALEEMISSDVNMEELTDQFIKGGLVSVLLKTQAAQVDPTHAEGLVFWDDVEKALSYYNEEPNTKINTGQELVIKVRNDTGVTITNGQVVRTSGSTGGIPNIVLALADTVQNGTPAGIATHDIADGATGYITRIGKLSDIDTSTYAEGDILYVSDTTPGALTNVSPGVSIPIAFVLTSSLTGQIYTSTSRAKEPVAIGQERSPTAPLVTQAITTTPEPLEGFDNSPFTVNTTINNIASGNGHRAQFSPASNAFGGYYRLSGSAAITSASNVAIFLEVYINGAPTGLISAVDLSNNNIDFGTASLSAFTETQLVPSDIIEAYIYTGSGTATITWNSLSFAIERLGVS